MLPTPALLLCCTCSFCCTCSKRHITGTTAYAVLVAVVARQSVDYRGTHFAAISDSDTFLVPKGVERTRVRVESGRLRMDSEVLENASACIEPFY